MRIRNPTNPVAPVSKAIDVCDSLHCRSQQYHHLHCNPITHDRFRHLQRHSLAYLRAEFDRNCIPAAVLTYALLNLKCTFLTSFVIYLLGSLICGLALTPNALIVDRAIAGVGNAGVFRGVLMITRNILLRKGSLSAGMVGALWPSSLFLHPFGESTRLPKTA